MVSGSTGKKYQVQSLPNSNYESMVVPLGVSSSSERDVNFSFSVKDLPGEYHVFLEDREQGITTRLSEEGT